ncbi:MAG TPA: DUF2007 domain-containing protein [Flavobacterium sp.]|nr:DUF2007 domain-containing protein [Flavobacterium sp.]
MEHFVTAAVFTYPYEITVLKLLLQEAGIQFYIENETMTEVFPFYSQALGGLQVKVHPKDLEAVKEILRKLEDGNNLKIV